MSAIVRRARSLVRRTVILAARVLAPFPPLKRIAVRLLHRMPWLSRRVGAILHGPLAIAPRRLHVPMDSGDLSPRVAALYRELQQRRSGRRP